MASTYLAIDNTKPLGAAAQQAIAALEAALERVRAVNDVLQAVATGSDWTSVQSTFGVTDGQSFYNLFTGAKAQIDVSGVTNLTSRCGRG